MATPEITPKIIPKIAQGTTPLRNSVWNALGSTMLGLNTFILLMLVSRTSDVATVGSFGIALTTAQLLYFVGVFGVDNYQMTDYREQFSFSGYFWTRTITGSLMMIICLAAVVISKGEAQKSLFILLLTLFYLLNLIGDLYQRLFFQKNRLDMSGKALFFRTALSCLAFVIAVLAGISIEIALVCLLIVNLISTWIWDVVPARRFVQSHKPIVRSEVIGILKACWPLFLSVFLMNIIFNLSKYGIALILDDTAQGWYNMLFIPTQVIGLISSFIFMPLFNTISEHFDAQRIHAVKRIIHRQIIIIAAITFAAVVVLFIWGVAIFSWVFQQDFVGLQVEMILIIIGGGLFALCQLYYFILVILRRQGYIFLVFGGGFLVSMLITWATTALFGLLGACIAFVLCHTALVAGFVLLVKCAMAKAAAKPKIDEIPIA